MLAIETKKLTLEYKAHFWSQPKRALHELDLRVEEGEIFGYLGANGAGKTTTIKLLVGLLRSTSGDASLFGVPVTNVNSRRAVGFQPENPYFYEYLTAVESMRLYAALCDVPRSRMAQRISELLEFVGLKEAANVRVKEYSKGMRQRLGIAQALVHKPKLVILDEPMSGLDPVGRRQVREAILTLKDQGLTVFFSSHILTDVEMICSRVGLLQHGRLEACGTLGELLQRQSKAIEVGAEKVSPPCREALQQRATRVLQRGATTIFVFGDWAEADRAVKALAAAGAHLSLLRPVHETLEEYFMRSSGNSRAEVGAWSGGADR